MDILITITTMKSIETCNTSEIDTGTQQNASRKGQLFLTMELAIFYSCKPAFSLASQDQAD